MSSTAATGRPGPVRRRVVRALVSLGASAALATWVLFALALWTFRCGDNCGSDAEVEHWRWTAQLILACVGSLFGAGAVVLGFTSRTQAYQVSLAASVGFALVWLIWVMGGHGGF